VSGQRALDERFREDTRAVTEEWCREVEAVAHHVSRHFALEVRRRRIARARQRAAGLATAGSVRVRLRAGSVSEVMRHRDGVGVLALDGLDGVDIAAPYLQAAFALLRGRAAWCWT
jgi:hypothetical protein